jgi:hypothetical protein
MILAHYLLRVDGKQDRRYSQNTPTLVAGGRSPAEAIAQHDSLAVASVEQFARSVERLVLGPQK